MTISVATTTEAVGLAVAGGESVAVAVAATQETVGVTVQPGGDAVNVEVAEQAESVGVSVVEAVEAVSVAVSAATETVTITVGEGEGEPPGLTWSDLVTRWDAAPSPAGSTAAGEVYAYQLDGVTRYRLVPEPYAASGDRFYGSFVGGVLTTPLASRG